MKGRNAAIADLRLSYQNLVLTRLCCSKDNDLSHGWPYLALLKKQGHMTILSKVSENTRQVHKIKRWRKFLIVGSLVVVAFGSFFLMRAPVVSPFSEEYPAPKKYMHVNGKKMAYVEVGDPSGDLVVFIHGQPTSSYLWRNVMPMVAAAGKRCIAFDLIGMGDSDELNDDIEYSWTNHYAYVAGFFDALLQPDEKVTLVVHDWGSALGFNWAMQHQDRMRGLVHMESLVHTLEWEDMASPFKQIFRLFRLEGTLGEPISRFINMRLNFFVKVLLPKLTLRTLSPAEKAEYARPFPTYESRRVSWNWPRNIAVAGIPEDSYAAFSAFQEWLPVSEDLPKLLILGTPGRIFSIDDNGVENGPRKRVRSFLNQDEAHVRGLHFLQEDSPYEIGQAITEWMEKRL
jgi:haloalkane dehalogenase